MTSSTSIETSPADAVPDVPNEVFGAKPSILRANGPQVSDACHRATISDAGQGKPEPDGYGPADPPDSRPVTVDGKFPVPVTFAFHGTRRRGTLLTTDGVTAIVRDESGWKMVVDASAVGRSL